MNSRVVKSVFLIYILRRERKKYGAWKIPTNILQFYQLAVSLYVVTVVEFPAIPQTGRWKRIVSTVSTKTFL